MYCSNSNTENSQFERECKGYVFGLANGDMKEISFRDKKVTKIQKCIHYAAILDNANMLYRVLYYIQYSASYVYIYLV